MPIKTSNNFNEIILNNPRRLTLITPMCCNSWRLVSMLAEPSKYLDRLLENLETLDKTVIIGKDLKPSIKINASPLPLSYDNFLNLVGNAFVNSYDKAGEDVEKFKENFKSNIADLYMDYMLAGLDNVMYSELFNKFKQVWLVARNTVPESVSKKESLTFKYNLLRIVKEEIGKYEEFSGYHERVNNYILSHKEYLNKESLLTEELVNKIIDDEHLLHLIQPRIVIKLPMSKTVQEWYPYESNLVIDYPSALDHLDDESLINHLLAGVVNHTKNVIIPVIPLGSNIPLKGLERLYIEKFDIHTSKSKTLVAFTNVNYLPKEDVENKMNRYMQKYGKIGCYLVPCKGYEEYNPKYLVQKYLGMLDKDFDYSITTKLDREKLVDIVSKFDITEIEKSLKSNIGRKISDEDLFNLVENMKLGLNYDSVNNPNEYPNCVDINWTFPTHLFRIIDNNIKYLIDCFDTTDKVYVKTVLNPRRITLNFLNYLVDSFEIYENSNRLDALISVAEYSIHSNLFCCIEGSIRGLF
jgi:hypothetical protein